MLKTDWRLRVLMWWAVKVCRIPFTVNFTPPDHDQFYGVGFAANAQAADRMRGDQMLIERLQAAQAALETATGTRKGRRIMNAGAKRAAREAVK